MHRGAASLNGSSMSSMHRLFDALQQVIAIVRRLQCAISSVRQLTCRFRYLNAKTSARAMRNSNKRGAIRSAGMQAIAA